MYCEHCGMVIGDPKEPCPACGLLQTPAAAEVDSAAETAGAQIAEAEWNRQGQEAQSPAPEEQEPVDATAARTVLILGIVGLILAGSVYLSIPGVVVSAIALYRGAALAGTATGGTQPVKCGTVLAWIGMILGALLTLAAVVFLVSVSRYAIR